MTGCGTGIGRATVIAACTNRLKVVGIDINEIQGDKTVEMVKALGGDMTFIKADPTRDKKLETTVEQAAGMGQIKYLANFAGVQHIDTVEKFPIEKYDPMLKLTLRAPFFLSQLTITYMNRSCIGVPPAEPLRSALRGA